ncbi:MAG TPA: LysE family translocator [Caulobacteraceae bacterium]|nr:LysE family translocator [Caulobacteraceae bacterium]
MTELDPQLLGAFAVFACVASITPGPNNAMLMASGANFGLRASLPHMAGVFVGFLLLLIAVGAGLGGLFTAYPVLHQVIGWAGAAYLLYLAVRIALSDKLSTGKGEARPLRFMQAVSFQAVNPKAWASSIGAMTTYAPQTHYLANATAVMVLFSLINIPSIAAWTLFGVAMRRFLDRPAVLRTFNIAMGLLLALSLVPGVEALAAGK